MAGSALLGACGGTAGEAPAQAADAARHAGTARVAARSILDRPATACPIDHVVVLMMENRSFDHWLGWLADDQAWLDRGRKRYGRSFSIAGDQTRTFPDPVTGSPVGTACHVNCGVHAPLQGRSFTEPIVWWGPTSTAPSNLVVHDGTGAPEWRGQLFMGALAGQRLWRIALDSQGHFASCEALLGNLNQRIRDVRQGPDGALWLATDSGQILRVTR